MKRRGWRLGVLATGALAVLAGCADAKIGTGGGWLTGQESSGGIEVVSAEDGTTWFLGRDRIVRYCLERTADFPMSGTQAAAHVEKAFAVWRDYFVRKKLPRHSLDVPPPAVKHEAMGACDGSEDLKIEFGTPSPQPGGKAIAVAKLLAYDAKKGWGRGILWFGKAAVPVPGLTVNWGQEKVLLVALLHEVGHMYGTGHVDGTVMTGDLAASLLYPSGVLVDSVDWQKELMLPCPGCEATYHAVTEPILMKPGLAPPISYLPAAFEALTGRKPVGAIGGRLVVKRDEPVLEGEYQLHDQVDSFRLRVRGGRKVAQSSESADILKRYYHGPDGSITYVRDISLKLVELGRVDDARGTPLAVTISRNMDGHAVVIRTLNATEPPAPVLFAARANPRSQSGMLSEQ